MGEIRFDITFITSIVSQFAKIFFHQHSKVVKTIFRYLKATRETEIIYKEQQGGDLIIKEYYDSNWADNHSTRKLTSRYIFMFKKGPIS